MAIFNGSNLVVKTGGTPVAIACATSCTLTVNQEAVEASCKDSGKWVQSISGKASWEISTDNLGSVICKLSSSGPGPKVVLAGHMDEIGFMVKLITDGGFLKFQPLEPIYFRTGGATCTITMSYWEAEIE